MTCERIIERLLMRGGGLSSISPLPDTNAIHEIEAQLPQE